MYPTDLTGRLNGAYDRFLALLPENTYASVNEKGWQLSAYPTEKIGEEGEQRLEALRVWLSDHLRDIKLPELLVEVDNELHFTRHFLTPIQGNQREAEQVCTVLATIMAHGCNVGPYTMAQLTVGIMYPQIKQVTDWQLTEEAQRQALAQLVNAISRLDVTQAWGEGKTSSSDSQRFRFRRKVLQRTYSHRLNDYALEFYSFVADNYAPFYSTGPGGAKEHQQLSDTGHGLYHLIYWQAKEINRVLLEEDPEGTGGDLSLLEHISPVGWENVILYDEYVLNRRLVRS